jgi:hypothetical protein
MRDSQALLPNEVTRQRAREGDDWSPHSECDARCSASHRSLIRPRLAEFPLCGSRILGMMTTAINTMTMARMNSIGSSPLSGPRSRVPSASHDHDTRPAECLCVCAQGPGEGLRGHLGMPCDVDGRRTLIRRSNWLYSNPAIPSPSAAYRARAHVAEVRPGLPVLEVSAKTGAGMDAWLETLVRSCSPR